MNFRAIIIGIAGSAILLAVLGLSRLINVVVLTPDLTVREVDFATLTPPPPPPLEEPPPELTPPPPPALTQINALPDPTRVPVPQAQLPMDITAPVEDFFADLEPAPLPVAPVEQPVRQPVRQPSPPSHVNVGDLDAMPKLLAHGSAVFPSALARRGISRGTVVLEVEINTTGAVSVRRVVSASYPELVDAARRVAAPARFTAPKHKGKVVNAIMRWPITIEK